MIFKIHCSLSADRDLPLAHRTTSLERAKAPELSVSIPAFGADHMEPSEQAAVYAYRRRPTGSVSSSGSRPKSAATPASILSGNSANVEQLDEDIDGKISLEQFLRESNRSPKSRVSFYLPGVSIETDLLTLK